MAAILEARSGLPPAGERAPLPERQKAMKESLKKATRMVFPFRLLGAADLVKMINDAGMLKAAIAKESPRLKAPQADPNEMKLLWDLAREFRDYVKKNPVDADYVLYADFVFNPDNWKQGFMHFVVCDRKGEWVIVELANSDNMNPDNCVVMEKQQHSESAVGCQSQPRKGFRSYVQAQLFCLLVARLILFIVRPDLENA